MIDAATQVRGRPKAPQPPRLRGSPHAVAAPGAAGLRMQTVEGRTERAEELRALAHWYAKRGDAATAADYAAQAEKLVHDTSISLAGR